MSAAITASDAQPPKAGKKKLPLIIIAVVVLAAAGGGGWYFWQQRAAANAAAPHAKPEPKAQLKKQLYIALEPFTVNLQDSHGERFAQIGVTLQVEDPSIEADLKDRLPTVRNQILILISSKRIEELLTPEGKKMLAHEIRMMTGRALGLMAAPAVVHAAPATFATPPTAAPAAHAPPAEPESPIKDVLFSQFIVQ